MTLSQANALHIPLANESVHCCITSPPYWGLRDYGVVGQLGLEAMPDEYVANMVLVGTEIWRVLRDDGTLWLNLGDSYWNSNGYARADVKWQRKGRNNAPANNRKLPRHDVLKIKDLCGIPWRVAFALQAAGWYLRSDIIWSKPNPMPESVTDRPTKSHEYLFLLVKQANYYYDQDAIREPHMSDGRGGFSDKATLKSVRLGASHAPSLVDANVNPAGRNRRSVWTIATQPYSGAHFATFPEALVEPCILAGSRKGDVIFDPFCGTATVGRVAVRHGRRFIGLDLNMAYLSLAQQRNAEVQTQFIIE